MAKFGSDGAAPTLGKAKAKTILSDGTVRGKKLTPKQRGLFGAIAGGAKLRGGGGKTKPASRTSGGAAAPSSSRVGYGSSFAMGGAGDMEKDTAKYGKMMKGKK